MQREKDLTGFEGGGRGHEQRDAGHLEKLEKARQRILPRASPRRSPAQPTPRLQPRKTRFQLPTSRTLKEYICVAFSH